MNEKMPESSEEKRFTRRDILRISALLGASTLAAAGGAVVYTPTRGAYSKFRSIGNDYSNYPFLEALGAQQISQGRLNELRGDTLDEEVPLEKIRKEQHEKPDSLTEFTFMLDEPGPVYARFDGLEGTVSLAVLKASINHDEELYVPIVRGPNKESPAEIQLGQLPVGEHHLAFSLASGSGAVTSEEIAPLLSRGDPNSIRSVIDRHQPDIFLRDDNDITNNIPLRSVVFVHETADAFALIYWTECLGEDPEYRLFGTKPETLVKNKNRTVDWDWILEAHVDKSSGELLMANVAEPYHNRRPVEIDSSYGSHLPIRIASSNNNVVAVTDSSVLQQARFRPRPELYSHDDRKVVLYGTSKDTATLSLMQHIKKGNINLNNTYVKEYLATLGLDISDLRS